MTSTVSVTPMVQFLWCPTGSNVYISSDQLATTWIRWQFSDEWRRVTCLKRCGHRQQSGPATDRAASMTWSTASSTSCGKVTCSVSSALIAARIDSSASLLPDQQRRATCSTRMSSVVVTDQTETSQTLNYHPHAALHRNAAIYEVRDSFIIIIVIIIIIIIIKNLLRRCSTGAQQRLTESYKRRA